MIERFSNDKVITLTKHSNPKQRDELIRIPRNYTSLAQSAGKITRIRLVILLYGHLLTSVLKATGSNSKQNTDDVNDNNDG